MTPDCANISNVMCISAELLTQASRQILIEMVSVVFKGLDDIPSVAMTPTTARSLVDLAHSPRLQVSPDESQGPLLNPFTGDQPQATTASTAGKSHVTSRHCHCYLIMTERILQEQAGCYTCSCF